MRYKNKNEKLAAIEKHTTRLKELLETYQRLLKDLIVIQGDSSAYYKNGEMREEVSKKWEEADTINVKMRDELKRLHIYWQKQMYNDIIVYMN